MKNEDFVKKWLEAKRLDKGQSWVAEQLNVSRQHVNQKAAYLRKLGVKLPYLIRGARKPLDISGLNRLIEEDN